MSGKTKYEGYPIGSTVFAIAEYRSKEIQEGVHSPYVAIFTAIVKDVWFSVDKKTTLPSVEYGLATPNGEDWGDSVTSHHVSDKMEDLVEFMKPIWETQSNTH